MCKCFIICKYHDEGTIMIFILFFMDEDETLDLIIWIFITPPKVGCYGYI